VSYITAQTIYRYSTCFWYEVIDNRFSSKKQHLEDSVHSKCRVRHILRMMKWLAARLGIQSGGD
jgi:hypothetical protein